MEHRDEVYFEAEPEREIPFSEGKFSSRLDRVRAEMAADGLDCLFLTSPESLYDVSAYRCLWSHTESPIESPGTSGIAVHVDHDRFIHFECEREAVLMRTFSMGCSRGPLNGRRSGAFPRLCGGHCAINRRPGSATRWRSAGRQ